MDACVRAEFGLSMHEYHCLMRTLRARFGVEHIQDICCLSETERAVTDRWEAAALKRLFEIAVTHIGVEKLHRAQAHRHDSEDARTRSPELPGSRRAGKGARAQTTRTDHEVDALDVPIVPVSSDDRV
jgi:hypothetical protein